MRYQKYGYRKKSLKSRIIVFFAFLFLIIASIFLFMKLINNQPQAGSGLKEMTRPKEILILIADQGFQDQEYIETRSVLEEADFTIKLANYNGRDSLGKFGNKIPVDYSLKEDNQVDLSDFAALVIIGGPGAIEYLDNPKIYHLVQQFMAQNKVCAAICIAPVILARSGALINRKATVWSSELDRWSIEVLKENQAEYSEKEVIIDGKIITANGSQAASQFGKKIAEILK